MVSKKVKPVEKMDWNKANGYSEILDTRWLVIEHTPAYNTGGYYDQDIPEKNEIVSPYFKTKEEAVAWMNDHVPDKGKTLWVRHQNKRSRTIIEWGW